MRWQNIDVNKGSSSSVLRGRIEEDLSGNGLLWFWSPCNLKQIGMEVKTEIDYHSDQWLSTFGSWRPIKHNFATHVHWNPGFGDPKLGHDPPVEKRWFRLAFHSTANNLNPQIYNSFSKKAVLLWVTIYCTILICFWVSHKTKDWFKLLKMALVLPMPLACSSRYTW